jgi:Mg-chelatase subunit ChlI
MAADIRNDSGKNRNRHRIQGIEFNHHPKDYEALCRSLKKKDETKTSHTPSSQECVSR